MSRVTFRAAMPARDAFRLGRLLVVPSRAKSLPYVVLEAAGAGVPIIATDVGGIPEIFGPMRRHLIPSDSVSALGDRVVQSLTAPAERRVQDARTLAEYVRNNFSLVRMVDGILAAYRDAASIKSAHSSVRSHTPRPSRPDRPRTMKSQSATVTGITADEMVRLGMERPRAARGFRRTDPQSVPASPRRNDGNPQSAAAGLAGRNLGPGPLYRNSW